MAKWFIVVLVGSLLACQRTIDEQPQILGLAIANVAQENITLDQQQRLITVVLPPTLPSLELEPTFSLSAQAHLAEKEVSSLANYCPSLLNGTGRSPSLSFSIKVQNRKQINDYTVQLKSAAPLRIIPPKESVVYDSKKNQINDYYFEIPVEHYYGSSFIEFIAVTPTGSTFPNWIGPGGALLEACAGQLNKVGISLYGYRTVTSAGVASGSSLKPGLYDLDFWLIDGTQVHAENYFLIKKGLD